MPYSDARNHQRTDAHYCLPFLTACAAALHDQGYLSAPEADQLRQELKERHRTVGAREGSLWLELLEDKSPLVRSLEALIGSYAVSRLFLRWTVARLLDDTLPILQGISVALLKKAELMFNQPFYLYQGTHCERRTLFSFFLVDAGEELLASYTALEGLMQELKSLEWFAAPTGSSGHKLGCCLAQHLGFTEQRGRLCGELRLETLLHRLHLELRLLGERMRVSVDQLPHNLDAPEHFEQLALTFDVWQVQLTLLTVSPLPEAASLERMEQRRLRLLGALLEFQLLLERQKEQLQTVLKTGYIRSQLAPLWPEVERREVLAHLLARGLNLREAEPVLTDLLRYCEQHQVRPEQLLTAELQRIHPLLDTACLDSIKALGTVSGDHAAWAEEKQTVLSRKDHLLHKLTHGTGPLALITLGLTMWFGACGVKTAPRSDVLDLRPAVPYHAEQRASPKSREQTAPAPQSTDEE